MKRMLCVACLSLSFALGVAGASPVLRSSQAANNIFVDFGEHPAATLTNRQPFTVELWANFATLSYYGVYCFSYGERPVAFYSKIAGTYGTGGSLYFEGVMTSPGMLPNTWQHLAFTYDGTTLRAYQNGALQSSKAFSYTAATNQFMRIGGRWYPQHGRPLMSGWLSEYRIWDHARSADEIANYQYRRLSGREAGLRGYWPCVPSSDHDLADYSTNAMHGAFLKYTADNVPPDPATTLYFEAADGAFPLTLRLGEPTTGDAAFFSGGTLVPLDWVDYSGMSALQVTYTNDPAFLAPGGWTAYTGEPATIPCPTPAAEGPVTVTLWYTNLAADVPLRFEEWPMVYTRTAPVVSARATLSRLKRAGQDLPLYAWETDNGSSGGTTLQGAPLAVDHLWIRPLSAPDGVTLPDGPADMLDLPALGDYTFELIVRNNAGVIATSSVPTAVTVSELTDTTFTWTGAAGNGRWKDAGNWDPEAVPGDGDEVTVQAGAAILLVEPTADLASFGMTGGTLTFTNWTTCLRAETVTLGAGALITCAGPVQDDPAMSNRVWIVCSNLTVATGSSIDVAEKGYAGSSTMFGVGPGGAVNLAYVGGSHGGAGGYAPPYGDPVYPETLGSSGSRGTSASYVGGNGGGSIRIDAAGDVVINGTVRASGNLASLGNSRGCGAGGSVWITCRTLAGSGGSVLADGGLGDTAGETSGRFGGGGRIAVHYDSAAQAALPVPTITFSAYGRRSLGTLYFSDNRLLPEVFGDGAVCNGRLITPVLDAWAPARMVLDGAAVGLGQEAVDLTVTNDVEVRGAWGRLVLGETAVIDVGLDMRFLNDGSPGRLAVGGNLTVTNGGAVRCYAAATNGVPAEQPQGFLIAVGGDITVGRASWIYPHAHPVNGGAVKLACRDLLVPETPGGIDASTFGYMGVRNALGLGPGAATASGRGAGYGGYGGVMGGITYGTPLYPTLPGSAGARGDDGSRGSDGGGVVWIEASRHAVINGSLLAVAQAAQGGSAAVGSGGSVLLVCQTLAATNGVIRADSKPGQSGQFYKSGGGGRIALHYDTVAQAALPVPTLTLSAWSHPLTGGDVGTVYLSDARLLGDAFGPVNTIQQGQVFLGDWSGWQPATLTVSGDANVRLLRPGGLAVPGDLTVSDNGILGVGGDSAYYENPGFYHPLTEAATPALAVGGDLVMSGLATLQLFSGEAGATLDVDGDMSVGHGCTNRLYCHPVTGGAPLLRVRDLDVNAGGALDASAFGYCGIVQSNSVWYGLGPGGTRRGAASHGGTGGRINTSYPAGEVYGCSNAPVQAGSSGANDTTSGYAGGGVVRVEARSITCAGAIRADGYYRVANTMHFGSGGSVYLRCRHFTGTETGLITADGGGGGNYPAGGGGRVAVWRAKDFSTGQATATALAGKTTTATAVYQGTEGTVVWGFIPPSGTVLLMR